MKTGSACLPPIGIIGVARMLPIGLTLWLIPLLRLNAQPPKPGPPFRVLGYYKGDGKDLEAYDYRKLTHLVYCFAYLKGSRMVFTNARDSANFRTCLGLKKRYPHLKVLVSFGGWGGCETCSDVFSTDTGRKAFVGSVRDFVLGFGADGLDLDWESPVIGGYPNHKARPEDRANFTYLVRELRKVLPPPAELSFDANSFPEFLHRAIDWNAVMPQVDFVNLMTYGLPANKGGHTGHHTALFSSALQTESVDTAVKTLKKMGVPLIKILIGAAFYGFVVENTDSLQNGLGRRGKFKAHATYQELRRDFTPEKGYQAFWDPEAEAPYLFNARLRTFVTYDNRKSVQAKTSYALRRQLGGIMFWKLNGDELQGGLLDAIDETVRKGR